MLYCIKPINNQQKLIVSIIIKLLYIDLCVVVVNADYLKNFANDANVAAVVVAI